MNDITLLLKNIGIHYKNIDIYIEAFTHSSFNNENSYSKNFQRLEFLGDAILQKNISCFLFNNYKNSPEGEMTLIRSKFVNNKKLSELAKKLNFDKYIKIGKSVDNIADSILSDVFEAFIGALYLDKGNDIVNKFLKKELFKEIRKKTMNDVKNAKTLLQEHLQLNSSNNINYIVNPNQNGFQALVYYNNILFGKGTGVTKKKAEISAASSALNRLCKNK